jgi:carbonic anhydrase/acetyltransferase-like protein (isoleucine patch superfamily)
MLLNYLDFHPKIHSRAWVAGNADVIGDVELAEDASIWFQCVVRADVSRVRIGARSNIQDHSTIHVSRGDIPTIIGEDVTLGHRAVVHAAEVRNGALVGIGAVVLDEAVIGEGAIVAAMSLVTPGMVVPAGKMVMGTPARVVRDVSESERAWLVETVRNYVDLSREYRVQGG